MGGGGGYTIHLSYGWVVEEVILPVEEVILFCGGGYTPCGGGYSHSCDFGVSPRSKSFFFSFYSTFIRLGGLLGPGFGPGLDN